MFWFTDEQWKKIEPLLPAKPRGVVHRITPAAFEENLVAKIENASFTSDVPSLLTSGRDWKVQDTAALVLDKICPLLANGRWD